MAIRPDVVRRSELRADHEGVPMGRLNKLRAAGLTPGISWYADHPTHYRGDGLPATTEKGERKLDAVARSLAHCIRLVKEDKVSQKLQKEFADGTISHTA